MIEYHSSYYEMIKTDETFLKNVYSKWHVYKCSRRMWMKNVSPFIVCALHNILIIISFSSLN